MDSPSESEGQHEEAGPFRRATMLLVALVFSVPGFMSGVLAFIKSRCKNGFMPSMSIRTRLTIASI